jgi:hypothetical protein
VLYISSIHGVAHFMPHDGMVPCHLPHAKSKPVLGYFASSPPGDAQASKASDPRARLLTLQVDQPKSSLAHAPYFTARGKKTKCTRHAILSVVAV